MFKYLLRAKIEIGQHFMARRVAMSEKEMTDIKRANEFLPLSLFFTAAHYVHQHILSSFFSLSAMEGLTLILTSILGFCTFFYALAAYIRPYSRLKAISSAAKRVLLVIAHPDDETMFFGPTLLNLNRKEGTEVYLLCLSNGDYRQGASPKRHHLK